MLEDADGDDVDAPTDGNSPSPNPNPTPSATGDNDTPITPPDAAKPDATAKKAKAIDKGLKSLDGCLH